MKRILIIDDEVQILMMLKKMLERSGYEVDLAANGHEGLRLLQETGADLVITDIIMPEKEGLETIREMQALEPGLKMIAISGGGKVNAESYLQMARGFGAQKVLSKPFTKKEVLDAVDSLLVSGEEDS
ncbi:MAG: response regulator [Bacteroidales bacterium]